MHTQRILMVFRPSPYPCPSSVCKGRGFGRRLALSHQLLDCRYGGYNEFPFPYPAVATMSGDSKGEIVGSPEMAEGT